MSGTDGRSYRVIFILLATALVLVAFGKEIIFQSALLLSSNKTMAQISRNGLEHDQCKYSFQFDGDFYIGTGSNCSDSLIGSDIEINYNRYFPYISSNKSPGSGLLINTFVSLLAILFSYLLGLYRDKIADRP